MSKKVIFMGTNNFAVPILKAICESEYEITAVYTQPPKKSNRGQKITKSPVHIFSEKSDFKIRIPNKLKYNRTEFNYMKNLKFDIAIVVAYGQIIPKEILNLKSSKFINIHASLLPKYRGAAPIQRSLMNLDKETGITIMQMTESLDSGPIFTSFKQKIEINDNFQTLSEKLSKLAAHNIKEVITKVIEDKFFLKEQEKNQVSYANKIQKSEGKINWNDSAHKILGIIKGLSPNPGAYFLYEGTRYKILGAKIKEKSGEPSLVLDNDLTIGCGTKSIEIDLIQREGKKVQSKKDFLVGSKIKMGINLEKL